MGVFHVFYIVQVVPNSTTHHICGYTVVKARLCWIELFQKYFFTKFSWIKVIRVYAGVSNYIRVKCKKFIYFMRYCDCKGNRTHTHLIRKQKLNQRLIVNWLWVRIPLQSLKFQISSLFRARSSLTFKQ